MKVEGGKGTGRRVKVAKLQYTPHLFLWRDHARASHEVYTTIDIQQLTQALVTASQKEVAAPLKRWCAVSCVRSSIVGNLRPLSRTALRGCRREGLSTGPL
jgi:hypothetical protein